MAGQKIPLLLVSFKSLQRVKRRLRWLGQVLMKVQPRLGATLPKIGIEIEAEAYAVGAFFSAFFYGFLFFILGFAILTIRGEDASGPALAMGLSFWLLFFLLHMVYPGIILKKIAVKEGRDLLFALREMMMNAGSGVPLFESMVNVGEADYGYVSADFQWVVTQIQGGVSEREAVRRLALKSENEYLRRAAWQIVNALEAGTGMSTALPSIVQSLENSIYRSIKDYSTNLNFLMLLYMLASAVLPSLGITFMVLLSAFGGLGVTVETIAVLIGTSAVIQIAMIGYMASTRPGIFGG